MPAESPRPPTPSIPLDGDEPTLLIAFLEYYRAALVDRVFGLADEELQIALPPSTLTLSRLIGHMAMVEDNWFPVRFSGAEPDTRWVELDWESDLDAEMTLAQTWSFDQLRSVFDEAVARSRQVVADAESLDQLSARTDQDGQRWNLRWILIHMIEEYARHCGHADLIRESIDGDLAD
jgi:uncharacterized damage-inducible protein DinB